MARSDSGSSDTSSRRRHHRWWGPPPAAAREAPRRKRASRLKSRSAHAAQVASPSCQPSIEPGPTDPAAPSAAVPQPRPARHEPLPGRRGKLFTAASGAVSWAGSSSSPSASTSVRAPFTGAAYGRWRVQSSDVCAVLIHVAALHAASHSRVWRAIARGCVELKCFIRATLAHRGPARRRPRRRAALRKRHLVARVKANRTCRVE